MQIYILVFSFQVNHYPHAAKGANFHNLDNVDASVDAKIQRVNAYIDINFIENILVSYLVPY